ncbi:hypothetical protein FSP39_002061 [Pinctada imbricata]|uniref:Uncharacterized protein n=1 Tax=Pinctada imbricata TaxID=66713 RepID=A0AA88YVN5_PINIB|nr:hypothetical protein FSP39_002061 [Pinctada imbricata]
MDPALIVYYFFLFRIFNDATGHTQIQYKKLSTDDQWHPSPDEKPLEIFQIQSGGQIIPIGQPDVVPEHIDEDEIKSFQRYTFLSRVT